VKILKKKKMPPRGEFKNALEKLKKLKKIF
jgi:hypothetical protein